jgi:hypothetical protein
MRAKRRRISVTIMLDAIQELIGDVQFWFTAELKLDLMKKFNLR